MVLSGLLHVLLPKEFIRKRFRGPSGVVSAVTLGIPLPLCSCGVIPAGIGLKNEGASDGAAVGFLISTPQTGVDSILVSASFFGWPFAIFKMVAALVTGVFGGLLADRGAPANETEQESHSSTESTNKSKHWTEFFTHAIDILRSIWIWLVIGIVVSAVIETWVPQSWIVSVNQLGLFPSMLLVLLVSAPLYVCATASVPIAAALVAAGLPPAAALVFLMAGPATNVTTMGAIYGRFGKRTLAIYILSIVGGSMLFASFFDWVITSNVSSAALHAHDHTHWISVISAIILLGLVGWFVWEKFQRRFMLSQFRAADEAAFANDSTGTAISSAPEFQKFKVGGLHCQNCVNKLEKALRSLPGLTTAHVDLKKGLALVSGEFTLDEIKATIVEAGFTAP